MSSQEPPKKKSKRDNGLFCLYIECACVDVMYLVHVMYLVFLQERMRNR